MSDRPVRTVAQVAAAVDVGFERAEELLLVLELMGHAEQAGAGYRRTRAAELMYPVLSEDEIKRRQVARRQADRKPGQCVYCARLYVPTPSLGRGLCSKRCEAEFDEMREAA